MTNRVEPSPILARHQPYCDEYGFVEGERIVRLSHISFFYCDVKVSDYPEEATRGIVVAASLTSFRSTTDGRGEFFAVMSQHAEPDKWEAELKQDTFLKTRYWKGNTALTLDRVTEHHRNDYISMQQCAEHISYQLPNERTQVGYLLDTIQCPELQAALAGVRKDYKTIYNNSSRYWPGLARHSLSQRDIPK